MGGFKRKEESQIHRITYTTPDNVFLSSHVRGPVHPHATILSERSSKDVVSVVSI